jgi:hypothetical protein
MRPEIIDKLGEAHDFCALTKSVLSLCEPYGPVHAFRLIHNRGAARVACLIELESPKQQPALARALGGRTLNGAVTLDIPVSREFGDASHGSATVAGPYPRVPPIATRTANNRASA